MMNRNFSPQQYSPRSPGNFPNRFQFQSPYNSNNHPPMQYGSPQSSPGFHHNNRFNTPDIRQRNSFDFVSPKNAPIPSPRFHSSPRLYSPRNNSIYGSYNNSLNSSWNNQSNRSFSSSRNSSSYFADTSGSPYSIDQRQRYKDKKNQSANSNSNPGHSYNIEDYIHPSMLEDPWEKDMVNYEKKKEQLNRTES